MSATKFSDMLGRTFTLPIRRIGTPGAFLALDPDDASSEVVLLLGSELEKDAKEGDLLAVFLHRDSEGRPLATTKTPRLTLGEVAFLRVTARSTVGVFVDWGLPKELLVPFAEETTEMRVGERYAVGLYIDSSDRLAGTMRVAEMLEKKKFECDEWVTGEAWRKVDEVGLFVLVNKKSVGLVPKDEVTSLAIGDAARFRVSHIHADGKIELSLRAHAHEEMENDAARVLERLAAQKNKPMQERASPEEIRARFGLSKKAWKRAIGRLLREGRVAIDDAGIVQLVAPTK